jgi:hypothetical protein
LTTVFALAAALLLIQLFFSPFPAAVGAILVAAGPIMALIARNAAGASVLDDLLVAGPDRRARGRGMVACGAGFIVLLAAVVFLEARDPYYFTQDDNLTALPVTIAACRGAFRGIFPTLNPYQFLGQPTSVQSIYALTYPFTYIAFAIARALGGDHLFVEVFALGHILAGYFATFAAARYVGSRNVIAATASLSFVLSGAALMISRSYAQMAPVLVWAPLLVIAVEWLRRNGGSTRWAVLTGLVIGFFCHCGNGQMWLYAVMFSYFAIAVLFTVRAIGVRTLLWAAMAGVIGLGLSLPLAIPQMWFMTTVVRFGGVGHGIVPYLRAMFLPMPLVHAAHPQGWGDPAYMATLYYSGTLLTVLVVVSAVAIVGLLISARVDVRALIARHVWLVCAVVALLIAFGSEGPLWDAMSVLPVFNKFTGPWKLLLYFNLFAAISGAYLLERVLGKKKIAEIGAFAVVAALLFLNAYYLRTAFYNFADKPYPPLPRRMAALLRSGPLTTRGRIFPVAPERHWGPGYVLSLMHALPSYYEILAFDGYDPFVRATPENLLARLHMERNTEAAARAYGVRWIIVHRSARQPVRVMPDGRINSLELVDGYHGGVANRILRHAALRLHLPELDIWEVQGADPLAFPVGRPQYPLPIALDQAGATVDVRPGGEGPRSVVVNILLREWMDVTVDGREVPVLRDSWERLVAVVPPGGKTLRVTYSPPFLAAIGFGGAVVLLGLLGCSLLSRSTSPRGTPLPC